MSDDVRRELMLTRRGLNRAVDENATLRASLAEARERVEALEKAMKLAEHELITLHNLDASDDPERLFRNPFTIDTSAAQKAVRAALSRPSPQAAPKHYCVMSDPKACCSQPDCDKPQATAGKELGRCEHGRFWRYCYYCAPSGKPEGRGGGSVKIKRLPHDTPEMRRFSRLSAARAKIELAVLAAMPLVFTEAQSEALVLRKDKAYIRATWEAIDKATRMAYLAVKAFAKPAPELREKGG